MSEPDLAHTFDKLLARVERLEQENADLRVQVTNLEGDLVKSIRDYNQEYLTIYELLWPLVYKAFPGLQTSLHQFDTIMDAQSGRDPKSC
jgi:hypothetical protein